MSIIQFLHSVQYLEFWAKVRIIYDFRCTIDELIACGVSVAKAVSRFDVLRPFLYLGLDGSKANRLVPPTLRSLITLMSLTQWGGDF